MATHTEEKGIAVAVSDKPTGPLVDAEGSALITNEVTPLDAGTTSAELAYRAASIRTS